MSSSYVTQYVRAGACTENPSMVSALVTCALDMSACSETATFWSAHQLAQAPAGTPAAVCLQAESTNTLLTTQCGSLDPTGPPPSTGACFVDYDSVYQCAVNEDGCASDATYIESAVLMAQANIVCQLCGLDSSMDGDLSDLLPPTSGGPTTTTADGVDPTGDTLTTATGDALTTATGDALPTTTVEGFPTTTGDSFPTTTGDAFPTTTGDAFPTTTGDGLPTTTGDDLTTTAGYGMTSPTGYGVATTTATDGPGFGNDGGDGTGDSLDGGDEGAPKNNNTNILEEFEDLDEEQKMEAAAVFGIIIGILIGCFLLLWCQRLWRRWCGGGLQKRERRSADYGDMALTSDEDDEEDKII